MKTSPPPEVERIVEERVRSGKYRTAEDVVTAAVLSLHQRETLGDFAPGELDELIAEGERSGEPLDAEHVFAELRDMRERK